MPPVPPSLPFLDALTCMEATAHRQPGRFLHAVACLTLHRHAEGGVVLPRCCRRCTWQASLQAVLREDLQKMWDSIPKPPHVADRPLEDFFHVGSNACTSPSFQPGRVVFEGCTARSLGGRGVGWGLETTPPRIERQEFDRISYFGFCGVKQKVTNAGLGGGGGNVCEQWRRRMLVRTSAASPGCVAARRGVLPGLQCGRAVSAALPLLPGVRALPVRQGPCVSRL